MNRRTKNAALAACAVLAAVFGTVAAVGTARAAAGDPTVAISAPSTVVATTPITFTVTVDQPYTPTCRITYTNPRSHSTINVANASAFTVNGNDWAYTPSAGEIGRTEVTTCTVGVPTYPGSRLVRLVSTSAPFNVVAS